MYPEYPYYAFKEECKTKPIAFPPQSQDVQPGMEYLMEPKPIFDNPDYIGSGKLKGKTAIISGGDSGIGKAAAVAYAKEGANVVIAYLNERQDALDTKEYIDKLGGNCILTEVDLRIPEANEFVVNKALEVFGSVDVLVNNCAVQYEQKSILDITNEQLHDTFTTNIYSFFYMIKAALPHMKENSSIINTTSVTAYQGHKTLLDYSATKGAIVTLTRSLSQSLTESKIRVNAIAPGPIWTPLQPACYDAETVSMFGTDTPMKRAGQPFELAPAYVYLACDDSRYVTGQVIHINGGTPVES